MKRAARCPLCRPPRSPATHVVKWPWGSVTDHNDRPVATRGYYCAYHAARVVDYQLETGVVVWAYRYRR